MHDSIKIEDAAHFEYLFRNNGHLGGETHISLTDALATPNAPVFLPKVISNVVKEAMEPLLVGTSLLQRVNYQAGQRISFPVVGAVTADVVEEGQEYPEITPQIGAGTVVADIGKHGIAVRVTEEMIRYSQFDVIAMMLRMAGRALARHKEELIFDMIRFMGTPLFDNAAPTKSKMGVTTGRGLDGSGNGSLSADDLFDAFAHIISQGFFPDTIMLHPLSWAMFVKDATLRSFVLQNGGGTFFANWTGNPAARAEWSGSSLGGLGVSGGQEITPAGAPSGEAATGTSGYNPFQLNSAPQLPGYMNLPFKIIVSPFMPFDATRGLTDIFVFDSKELGVLVVDEEVTVDRFTDPRVDIEKIKMRERYAIAMLNEGLQCATLRNISIKPNQVVLPAQASINVAGNIDVISPTANVLG